MKTFGAILLTLVAIIIIVVVFRELAVLVVPLIVIGTSIWVLIDANKIGVKAGQVSGMKGMGPFGWFFLAFSAGSSRFLIIWSCEIN